MTALKGRSDRVSFAKSMKTAPLYAGNLNLPGKIISPHQGAIMPEVSGGLNLLPLIPGVPLKTTPRPHDLPGMEPLIDAMTYSLPLKRLITGYSLPSIPNLKKSDLSIGYKYLDTQMDFPYILEGSENPCQIR